MSVSNDLGRDKISRLVFKIAIPSMLAQFISVLYSIVDRMFVGQIPEIGTTALAGVGICGPILTMIDAFAFWVGIGGAALMGITLGEGRIERARQVVANGFIMIVTAGIFLSTVSGLLKGPMLRIFGATETVFPYAEAYFTIYICGTVFALIANGMNQFIISQGYAKEGMLSVIIGACMNIILDPLFIFVFKMGIRGAALATIISQAVSASVVLFFLLRKTKIRLTFTGYHMQLIGKIVKLGFSPFAIIATDSLMIIAMNAMFKQYGGSDIDSLITCNAIVQSFMLVLTMPLGGISGGTQGIISYNYGACRSDRVIKAQKYIIALCVGYTTFLFILARVAGPFFASMFTSDTVIIEKAFTAIRISTLSVILLGIQYAIVDGFTAMGLVRYALPLSFLRKTTNFIAVFTIPTLFDPSMMFFAEPISDVIGPICTITIYLFTIKKILRKRELAVKGAEQNEKS